ncbi:MAG TPA: DMT family transporter [Trebonia sp.]|jgi:drug/metabolite transporter (DMT)-like permease
MTTVRAAGGPIATPGLPPATTAAPGARPALPRRSARSAGVAIGLLSAMCFGTSGTFGTALIGAGWSPAGAVFARVLVAALALTVPAVLALRGRWRALRRSLWQVTVYGLVGVAACQVCYFNAIARMPVGISIMLEYLGIVLIVLWLWVRHGQTPRPLTIGGGVAALGGLALMLNLTGAGGVSLIGVLFALTAAVSMAVYFFQSAATSGTGSDAGGAAGPAAADSPGDLPPVVLTWGGMIVGAAAIAVGGAVRVTPMRFAASDVALFGGRTSWIVPVLGLGVVAAAIAYVTGIGAARRLGPKFGSFVAMAEIGFAVLFAWILLHQTPTATQFVGGALILAGVIAVRLDEP